MERHTSKAGITGKYGTRYGQKLRKQIKQIEINQRKKSICPFCGKTAIKRKAVGIWNCRSCRRIIAGGAWEFVTKSNEAATSTINRLKKNLELKKSPDEELEEKEELKEENKKVKKEKKEGAKKEKKERKEGKKEKKEKK